MASVLITGGAGFIGSNFVDHWLAHRPGERVVVLDSLTYAGRVQNLDQARQSPEFTFVQGDIADFALVDTLLREHAIDTVVHFAAESHVDRSIHGPDAFVHTNVVGTHTLLAAVRAADERRGRGTMHFHHVSTDEVYGSLKPDDPAFTEQTPYAPNSPYAASKAGSDHLVRAYHHTFGLRTTTSNCSNNYGPRQLPEKLIPLLIVRALEGEPLPIYGDGQNVRDWLHVEDHCRGIMRVIEAGAAGETYNIGGENEWSNVNVATLVCSLIDEALADEPALRERFPRCPAARGTATASLLTYVPDRPGHDRRYAIDPARIRDELGFRPVETFESGLRQTVRWYLNNEPWWRAAMAGDFEHWVERNYSGRVAR